MGITLPAGLEIIYNKTLRMYDISVFCNVGKNPRFFPRDKKYTLREITYLFNIAYIWAAFSQEVKDAWKAAAEVIGQHGYNLFVQDKSYRIKNGIGGNAEPSLYHQYLVGHVNLQSPASSALIAQYNTKRVNFPASFEICRKTNLVDAGVNLTTESISELMNLGLESGDGHLDTEAGEDILADGVFTTYEYNLTTEAGEVLLAEGYGTAKLKFTWTRYTHGQNIESVETINFPLVSSWTKETKNITQYSGIRGKWRIELELEGVTGDLWFDNFIVTYSGEIKTNDPYCEDVVKWYKNVNPTSGLTFETIYPTGGAL